MTMSVKSELAQYSIDLSIEVIEYYKWLINEKKEFVMSKQILRSGTSIGANIHEAYYAVSKPDFIAKMQIALKESSETNYWITILKATGYFDAKFNRIIDKNNSVMRMLTATLNTSKKKD